MRIAYYCAGLAQDGGAGTHARGLADAWARAGHEVLRLPPVHPAPSGPSSTQPRKTARRGLHVDLARDLRARTRTRGLRERLARAVEEFRPDVIVARRGLYDYALDALLRDCRAPWVAEVNTVVAVERLILAGSRVLPWEAERERRFVRGAAAVFAVTDEVRKQLVAEGVRPERIAVIHNGTDLEAFRPALEPSPALGDWTKAWSPIIGFCGTGSYTLDLRTMGTALPAAATGLPQAGFLFVGLTRDDVLQACPMAAGVGERLHCTGRLSHDVVPSYLAAADIFWAAYRNEYGSPLKQFEYMAMGKPMVIAGDGQAFWLVQQAACGFAVHREDATGLGQRLVEMGELPAASRSTLGEAGRRWVEQHGSWETAAQKVLEAYASLGHAGDVV